MTRLERVFGMHPLAIALLRRALGAVLLVDLAIRAGAFTAHYTEGGILPAAALADRWPSLYWLSESVPWATVLFALTAASAVGLICGWRPRWMSLGAWVLVVSLHNRNFAVFHSGDTVLRLALFWAILLPTRRTGPIVSLSTTGFTLQLALMFACALDFKLRGTAWLDGTAVQDALSVTLYARPWAAWIVDKPALVAGLTWATLAAQGLVPLLLLLPLRSPWPRAMGVAAILAMQTGFGSFLRLGIFPFVVCTWALALSPPELFDRLPRWLLGKGPPDAATPRWRARLEAFAAALALGLVLWWNLGEAGAMLISDRGDVPLQQTGPGRLAQTLRLDQRWAMFAPNPQIEDGRFALIGRGHDATSRDILEEVVGPADPMAMNHRWLLYLLDLQARSTPAELDALLSYGCRQSRPRPAEVELRFTHFDRLEGGRTTPPVTDVLRTLTCPQ